ncbi:MAG: helix-turn-helix domain-containing protein [Pseudomonadota bacterium]
MARYPAEHKARSTEALKSAAAQLFRSRGYAATSIDDLCAAAGLTRGTFYAHFPSKQALFEAVMEGPHDFVERLRARDDRALLKGAAPIAREYLNPAHRKAVLGGCSLASLAAETIRNGAPAQDAYARAVEALIAEFRREQPELDRERALAAAALAVGGLLMSGASGDNALANQLERAASRWVTQLLEGR